MATTEIDLDTWIRRSQYDLFRNFAQPHFAITARVDVTPIMAQRATMAISPFNAMLYCLMHAANAVPELRTRMEGARVVQHDTAHPSFTVPIDGDQFAFCEIDFIDDWNEFDARCRAKIDLAKNQTELVEETLARSDWIFLSCLPWLDFTEFRQPLKGPDDSTPRIAWGRIVQKNDGWDVAVNITVHHALVDGSHVGRFFSTLERAIQRF